MMQQIYEFLEVMTAVFVGITGLLFLLTYLERPQDSRVRPRDEVVAADSAPPAQTAQLATEPHLPS